MNPEEKQRVLERLAKAAVAAEALWDERMLGASIVVPERDDPDPLTQAWFELRDAIDEYRALNEGRA